MPFGFLLQLAEKKFTPQVFEIMHCSAAKFEYII